MPGIQLKSVAPLEEYFVHQAETKRQYNKDMQRFAGSPDIQAQLTDHFTREMAKGESTMQRDMAKGVTAVGVADIAPSIPQDLDPVYRSLDAKNEPYGRNMILRAVPKIQGWARQHEYALQTSTGMGGTYGQSTEYGVGNFMKPTQTLFYSYPRWQKLLYMRSRSANDVRSIGDGSEQQIRLNHRRLRNSNLIHADSRGQLSGVSGLLPKGIIQLIEEGTNGTTATGSDGYNYNGRGHTWDVKAQPMTTQTLRQVPEQLVQVWGGASNLTSFMPSRSISGLEAQGDTARRAMGPLDMYTLGQAVGGLTVNGRNIDIVPEDDLNPFSRDCPRGMYTTNRPEGAPTGNPTVAITVQTEGTDDPLKVYGLWDTNPYGIGTFRYVVTYMDDQGLESAGVLSSLGTVSTSGKEVKLTISGVPANATLVRIFRLDTLFLTRRNITSPAVTHSCWIADVAPPGTGAAFTWVDYNEVRPYCGTALILSLGASQTLPYMTSRQKFEQMLMEGGLENIAPFITEEQSVWAENTVREVYVGPQMFTHLLANTLDVTSHYLLGSWVSTEVTHPLLCGIIRNLPLT